MSARSSSIKIALNKSNDKSDPCNSDGYTSNAVRFSFLSDTFANFNVWQVVIMVGGAQEALNARPGIYKLVLKNRKGFVKIAIQTGVSIVPIFSFNEVEVFDQPANEPGSKIRKFQDFFKKWTGVAPALFMGRGFFQYSFGLIPRRHPITTVVGSPITTVKNPSPTNQEIDDLHAKFVAELTKLFEDHKHKYLKNAKQTKLIIE